MSEFVYFTPQEKEAARNADIAEMLERQGERLKRSGSEYEWGEGSERVTIRGNLWYHQYEQKGGNAVSFVQKFMDKTYVEAMKFILGDGAGEIKQVEPKQAKAKKKAIRAARACRRAEKGVCVFKRSARDTERNISAVFQKETHRRNEEVRECCVYGLRYRRQSETR